MEKLKQIRNLINYGQGLLGIRFWPGWSGQLVKVGERVFGVFREVLGRIVHQREPVVGGVHRVDTALLYNKVTEALFSLLKVVLHSRHNVFSVDFDKGVPRKNATIKQYIDIKKNAPVWSSMLVDEA